MQLRSCKPGLERYNLGKSVLKKEIPVKILSLMRLSAEDRAKIEAVDPAVQLTDAGGWFDGRKRFRSAGPAGAWRLAKRKPGCNHRLNLPRL